MTDNDEYAKTKRQAILALRRHGDTYALKPIIYGMAELPPHATLFGWVLPGGRLEQRRVKATEAAKEIHRLMVINKNTKAVA